MSRSIAISALTSLLLACTLPTAQAETVAPMQGQSPEKIQSDIAACQAQAGSSTTSTTRTSDNRSGGRLRGAAKGAAAGAAARRNRSAAWR